MAFRVERLNSEMLKSVTDIINNRLKDPRVSAMITVTKMDVAKDLKTAKIYVSIFGDEKHAAENFNALCSSAGFIRTELAADFKKIRTVPQLNFILDESAKYGERIDRILDNINKGNS